MNKSLNPIEACFHGPDARAMLKNPLREILRKDVLESRDLKGEQTIGSQCLALIGYIEIPMCQQTHK